MPLFKRPHQLMLRILLIFSKRTSTICLKSHLHLQKLMVGKSGGTSRLLMLSIVLRKNVNSNFNQRFFIQLSSLGYMIADMNVLLKEIGKCFKLNQSTIRRADGLHPGVLRGRFKTQMKNSVCFALARANALAICNQGLNGITHPC